MDKRKDPEAQELASTGFKEESSKLMMKFAHRVSMCHTFVNRESRDLVLSLIKQQSQ